MTELEKLKKIRTDVKEYLVKYSIKSLVIGVSGGVDSATNAAILKPVCDSLNIPLIGLSLPSDTNKSDEVIRAKMIGEIFCTTFKEISISSLFAENVWFMEDKQSDTLYYSFDKKIQCGNLKARIRMITLYDEAYRSGGIVVDNDNKTEHYLGFWTLNGDVGDITPMADLWKTDVYNIAKYMIESGELGESGSKAMQWCVECTPTDGLGITNSDLDQLGVPNYEVADIILKNVISEDNCLEELFTSLAKYSSDVLEMSDWVEAITNRYEKTMFKRNHPFKVRL